MPVLYYRDPADGNYKPIATGGGSAPTGALFMWPGIGTALPSGFLLCDGAAVSRTVYAALYAICSTAYGVGDGSTTFNLPNLKGRVPVGLDGSQAEFDSRGDTGGAKTHLLTWQESGMRDHAHAIQGGNTASPGSTGDGFARSTTSLDGNFRIGAATGGSAYGSAFTGNANATNAHNNLQPFLVVNFIIKT